VERLARSSLLLPVHDYGIALRVLLDHHGGLLVRGFRRALILRHLSQRRRSRLILRRLLFAESQRLGEIHERARWTLGIRGIDPRLQVRPFHRTRIAVKTVLILRSPRLLDQIQHLLNQSGLRFRRRRERRLLLARG